MMNQVLKMTLQKEIMMNKIDFILENSIQIIKINQFSIIKAKIIKLIMKYKYKIKTINNKILKN